MNIGYTCLASLQASSSAGLSWRRKPYNSVLYGPRVYLATEDQLNSIISRHGYSCLRCHIAVPF